MGILNGTTNYILTKMVNMGISFDEALANAQEKGYAERNPAADVEGKDACRKIAILASLVCGRQIDPGCISTEGITDITLEDATYARQMDMEIKLIGYSKIVRDKVFARVSPMMIPLSNPLACAQGVFNAILVSGNAVGDTMFYGRGAGKLPTASAVVGDVMDIVRGISEDARILWKQIDNSKNVPIDDAETNAFIRVKKEYANEAENLFKDSALLDAGVPGEVGILVYNINEKTLADKAENLNGFIKMIRMA
jgi:homoserine dehydrogenase